MRNRILTEAEVFKATGINPIKANIPFRKIGKSKMFILTDVFEHLEMTLPYRRFEPIDTENGYLIINSKIN
jgi:hypothetical protein